MATNRDFDLIYRAAYDERYHAAIKLLADIVKQQQKQIEVLQSKIQKEDQNDRY